MQTSNRAHCELRGGLGRGFRGRGAIHLSPWCLWNSYAQAACGFNHSPALVDYRPILRCACVVHICRYAGMAFPTGELLLRGPTTQPAADQTRIPMPRTEGGSLQSAVTSPKYNHVRILTTGWLYAQKYDITNLLSTAGWLLLQNWLRRLVIKQVGFLRLVIAFGPFGV